MDNCVKTETELEAVLNRLDLAIQTLSVNVEKTVQRCRPMAAQQGPGCANDKAKPSVCEVLDRLDLFTDRIASESEKLDNLLSRLKM